MFTSQAAFGPKLLLSALISTCLLLPAQAEEAPAADTPSADHLRGQLPLEELRNFTEIFERIRSSYVEEVDDTTLLEYAIDGMLSSLDPHSAYL